MKRYSFFFAIIFSFFGYSQGTYHLKNNKKHQKIGFKLLNNIIVVDLEVNGQKGSFILDTGVTSSIIFNREDYKFEPSGDIRKINLKGFGSVNFIEGIVSYNNRIEYENLVGTNQKVVLVFNDEINFSAKLGVTINGIIGNDFFKDLIVKVNYRAKKITVYNPKYFDKKNKKSDKTFPLEFHKKKPYIVGQVQINKEINTKYPVKLLIDTGGSDSVWLFEDEVMQVPEKNFVDFLGQGISGPVFGKKARIESFHLGNYKFKEPIVSFLDTTTTIIARKIKDRNGSIGGEILRRFTIWFDYKNKKITFRKNGKYKNRFFYNMSGMDINYDGSIMVSKPKFMSFPVNNKKGSDPIVNSIPTYEFVLRPTFAVANVRKGSPAEREGVLVGDILWSINGESCTRMSFKKINSIFYTKKNKIISLVVKRGEVFYSFRFQLLDKL